MPKALLIDMDGVLMRGYVAIPGAVEFLARLRDTKTPFLVLMNNSRFTPCALYPFTIRINSLGW
jgi:NagD protein